MDTIELLDKAKQRLGVDTDYKLAKALEISNARISDYRKGHRVPDVYACFKIAEVLQRSPTSVLAEVLAEKEKNEDKRLYFKRFFSIVWLWIVLELLLPQINTSSGNVYADSKSPETRATATYQPIMRINLS